MSPQHESSGHDNRVVALRPGRTAAPQRPADDASPVQDLARYERDEQTDDYRHRMITNAVAFAFVLALIGAGLWLADTMAAMRKSQDCVMQGRRNCAPVEVPRDRF